MKVKEIGGMCTQCPLNQHVLACLMADGRALPCDLPENAELELDAFLDKYKPLIQQISAGDQA